MGKLKKVIRIRENLEKQKKYTYLCSVQKKQRVLTVPYGTKKTEKSWLTLTTFTLNSKYGIYNHQSKNKCTDLYQR